MLSLRPPTGAKQRSWASLQHRLETEPPPARTPARWPIVLFAALAIAAVLALV